MTQFISACSFTGSKASDCFCWHCINTRIIDNLYKLIDTLEEEIKELKEAVHLLKERQ